MTKEAAESVAALYGKQLISRPRGGICDFRGGKCGNKAEVVTIYDQKDEYFFFNCRACADMAEKNYDAKTI